MELQFDKSICPCLRGVLSHHQTSEQTQEVRLTEDLPDIGRVLGCWGRALIRSKQWQSGEVTVSGGIMAWILYAPEDGSQPRCLDTWIPFQMKWDIPETKRDGMICVSPQLKGMDARSISARKMMVRAGISIYVQASEPSDLEIYSCQSPQDGVQLLKQNYPVELPQEAGEKTFQMEEMLELPEQAQIIYYDLDPKITEQKVLGSKLVFRGECALHMVYMDESQGLHTENQTIAFSQYTELDREYSSNAVSQILPIVTGMEIETDGEGNRQVKCSLVAQYTILDRVMLEMVEDAYCLERKLNARSQMFNLPSRLDVHTDQLEGNAAIPAACQIVLDTNVRCGNPDIRRMGDSVHMEIPIQYQVLYVDDSGQLQCVQSQASIEWSVDSSRENEVRADIHVERPQSAAYADQIKISVPVDLYAAVYAQQELPMITAVELGEKEPRDPARPSLILRRISGESMWDLAKEYGSTVAAIQTANQLTLEPADGQVLLVPVY